VVNDWYDRDVDAINEPEPAHPVRAHAGPLGLWMALWALLSLALGAVLGPGSSAPPWSA
jgi:chlorophyll synthase